MGVREEGLETVLSPTLVPSLIAGVATPGVGPTGTPGVLMTGWRLGPGARGAYMGYKMWVQAVSLEQ